jgi:hypothetical protein
MLMFFFAITVSADNIDRREFRVYPNPVERSASLTVEVPISEGEFSVFLFNTVGKLIYSTKTVNRKVEFKAPEIGGIYLLRIANTQRVVAVEKIIVKE